MLRLLQRLWFLLALLAVLTVGIFWPEQFADSAEKLPRDWIIGSVLLAMALPLPLARIRATLQRPAPALLALAINSVVVPLLAWLVAGLLVDDLAIGLVIAAVVPCTLASAAVWTRRAGGNEATSLLVTLLTNLSCFLVTPAWLEWLLDRDQSSLQFGEMVGKLLLLVLLPIVVAQLARAIPAVGRWTSARQSVLSTYAQLGILTLVFVASVHCGLKLSELQDEMAGMMAQLMLMLLLVAAVHTSAWLLGYWSAGRLGMPREEQIAVAFAGSQKTLTVGLVVALQFGGLTVLPMLAYHVLQLLIDTVLADRLRAK